MTATFGLLSKIKLNSFKIIYNSYFGKTIQTIHILHSTQQQSKKPCGD